MPEQPILSGYTYQPGRALNQPLPPQASQPLTPMAQTPDSIANYKATSHTGWIIAAVVVVVLAIIGGIIINNLPQPDDEPAAQAPTQASFLPSRAGGMGFSDGDMSGYWKITSAQWSSTGVRLTVEITVDTGTLYYDFYGYSNTDREQLWPVPTSSTDLEPGFLGPGETITGTVVFEVSKQPMTLIMTSRYQYQLSALTVPQ